MAIKYCKHTRRQFLVGSGKSLLTLPLLPSLLPKQAFAQSTQIPPRLMLFIWEHMNLENMWPDPEKVANLNIGTSGMKYTPLSTMGPVANHSMPLTHPMYETLKNKSMMTYLRGFRQMNWGGCHGNQYIAAAGDRDSKKVGFPTIDSIIERSSSVYPNGTPQNITRAIRLNTQRGLVFFYDKVGSSIEAETSYLAEDYVRFFNDVFNGLTVGSTQPRDYTNSLKSNILNRVYKSYGSFKGNRRISSTDKDRLTEHMDIISDLQRSFASVGPTVTADASCNNISTPTSTSDVLKQVHIYLDLYALAVKCNLSRCFISRIQFLREIPGLQRYGENVHGTIHGDDGAAAQLYAYRTMQTYAANDIAERILKPLDQEEGSTGRTYIDNMLININTTGAFQRNEANNDGGHGGHDSQQILIGSMGQRLTAGNYVHVGAQDNYPYNSFLVTLLQLMGMSPSEYAYATKDGRGIGNYSGYKDNYTHRNRLYGPIHEILKS